MFRRGSERWAWYVGVAALLCLSAAVSGGPINNIQNAQGNETRKSRHIVQSDVKKDNGGATRGERTKVQTTVPRNVVKKEHADAQRAGRKKLRTAMVQRDMTHNAGGKQTVVKNEYRKVSRSAERAQEANVDVSAHGGAKGKIVTNVMERDATRYARRRLALVHKEHLAMDRSAAKTQKTVVDAGVRRGKEMRRTRTVPMHRSMMQNARGKRAIAKKGHRATDRRGGELRKSNMERVARSKRHLESQNRTERKRSADIEPSIDKKQHRNMVQPYAEMKHRANIRSLAKDGPASVRQIAGSTNPEQNAKGVVGAKNEICELASKHVPDEKEVEVSGQGSGLNMVISSAHLLKNYGHAYISGLETSLVEDHTDSERVSKAKIKIWMKGPSYKGLVFKPPVLSSLPVSTAPVRSSPPVSEAPLRSSLPVSEALVRSSLPLAEAPVRSSLPSSEPNLNEKAAQQTHEAQDSGDMSMPSSEAIQHDNGIRQTYDTQELGDEIPPSLGRELHEDDTQKAPDYQSLGAEGILSSGMGHHEDVAEEVHDDRAPMYVGKPSSDGNLPDNGVKDTPVAQKPGDGSASGSGSGQHEDGVQDGTQDARDDQRPEFVSMQRSEANQHDDDAQQTHEAQEPGDQTTPSLGTEQFNDRTQQAHDDQARGDMSTLSSGRGQNEDGESTHDDPMLGDENTLRSGPKQPKDGVQWAHADQAPGDESMPSPWSNQYQDGAQKDHDGQPLGDRNTPTSWTGQHDDVAKEAHHDQVLGDDTMSGPGSAQHGDSTRKPRDDRALGDERTPSSGEIQHDDGARKVGDDQAAGEESSGRSQHDDGAHISQYNQSRRDESSGIAQHKDSEDNAQNYQAPAGVVLPNTQSNGAPKAHIDDAQTYVSMGESSAARKTKRRKRSSNPVRKSSRRKLQNN